MATIVIDNVPADRANEVVQGFEQEGASRIERHQNADGTFRIIIYTGIDPVDPWPPAGSKDTKQK